MKRYLIAVLVIAVTAVAGFTLPQTLLKWQDEQRLESIEIQDADQVILTAQTDLTLIEKLQLMQKKTVTTLEMAQGKNYTGDAIIVQVQQELKKLTQLEILHLERFDLTYGIADIRFWVDRQDGTQSMILWTVVADTGEGDLVMVVDDETGKILEFIYEDARNYMSVGKDKVMEYEPIETSEEELKSIAEKWGEYLGLDLIETYEKISVTGDMEIEGEMQKEIDALVKAGINEKDAYKKVFEAWGVEEIYSENCIFATYEDESGTAVFSFRESIDNTLFSVELSM